MCAMCARLVADIGVKQEIQCLRSLGIPVNTVDALSEAVATHVARAVEKLRAQPAERDSDGVGDDLHQCVPERGAAVQQQSGTGFCPSSILIRRFCSRGRHDAGRGEDERAGLEAGCLWLVDQILQDLGR